MRVRVRVCVNASALSPQPTTQHTSSTADPHSLQLDLSLLSSADESLADLQPGLEEEESGRRGGWDELIDEQKVS